MAFRRFLSHCGMAPPQSTSEKEGGDKPPRFPNFGFSRILPSRPSTSNLSSSSKLSQSATAAASQSDTTTDVANPPPSPLEKRVAPDISFEELLNLLSQSQDAATQLAFIEAATERLPSINPPPRADALAAALLRPCSDSTNTAIRHAAYKLLNAYLGLQSVTSITSIDRSTFWHIVKDAGSPGSILEWKSRAAALVSLSVRAQRADGMDGLVPCLLDWLRHSAIWRLEAASESTVKSSSPTSEESDECISWCTEQLVDVIHREAQSLLPGEVLALVETFDDVLKNALVRVLEDRDTGPSSTRQKAKSLDSVLHIATSHHTRKRHVASQSKPAALNRNDSGLIDHRTAGGKSMSSFLSTFSSLYLSMMRELLHFSLVPSTALSRLITTLTLLISYHSRPLPPVDVHVPTFKASPERQGTSSLNDEETLVWDSIRSLLASSGYATSTTRILRKLLLGLPLESALVVPLLPSSEHIPTSTQIMLKTLSAEGACRSMRLALRLAAEGRLARHWLSSQSDSYSHSGVPTFFDDGDPSNSSKSKGATIDDILLRAWGKEGEGGAWEVDRILGVLPEAVQVWIDARDGGRDEVAGPDRVLVEALGIVSDVVDEAVATTDQGASGWASNNINLGVSEGRLVGEVMEKAFQYAHHCRPAPIFRGKPDPSMALVVYAIEVILAKLPLQQINPPAHQRVNVDRSFVPMLMPTVTPSLPLTLLGSAPFLDDPLLSQLVWWFFAEGSLMPSSPEWLKNLSNLYRAVQSPSEGTGHPTPRALSSSALREVTIVIYQSVRDDRSSRLNMLETCAPFWTAMCRQDNTGSALHGIWSIIADGIVAGAADAAEGHVAQASRRSSNAESSNDFPESTKGKRSSVVETNAIVVEQHLRHFLCEMSRSDGCPYSKHRDRFSEEIGIAVRTPISPSRPQEAAPFTRSGIRPSPAPLTSEGKAPTPSFSSPFASIRNFASPRKTASVPQPAEQDVISLAETAPPISGASPSVTRHEDGCRSLAAVLTLIETFQALAFSPPHSLVPSASRAARAPASSQCIHVFRDILSLATPNCASPLSEEDQVWHERVLEGHSSSGTGQATCRLARLTILQWLFRLRADRDHRLYMVKDLDQALLPFASLLGRSSDKTASRGRDVSNASGLNRKFNVEADRARSPARSHLARYPPSQHNDDDTVRALKRERIGIPSKSRSPSPDTRLWGVPEKLSFDMTFGTRPSEGMTTYEAGSRSRDPETASLWLPTSGYVCLLLDIVKDDDDSELLMYTVCQLPIQLANKHLFCGPMTSVVMVKLASAIMEVIYSSTLVSRVGKTAHSEVLAMAYQVLGVLISYKRLFNRRLLDAIVETFRVGLGRYPVTVKPCLHSLALSAFELQPQMTRSLSQITTQLTQIVTNPAISVHILELLIIIASLPELYGNFTEDDYKRVFTVALRYIQHHNRPESSGRHRDSHALSQHVLAIAYYTIYVWFLALKRSERSKYVSHIIRSLLIANDRGGTLVVDEPTEVCFDWLARYAYGDAESKPARSFIGDVLSGPESVSVTGQKTWLQGNALLTIKSLSRVGWAEVECRRPSGLTRLYCRLQNISMFKFHSIHDGAFKRGRSQESTAPDEMPRDKSVDAESLKEGPKGLPEIAAVSDQGDLSSMSNHKPEIPQDLGAGTVDPSFLALQLSQYPETATPSRLLSDSDELRRTIRLLDVTPVIDSHTIAVLYVAPGQSDEREILGNRHGSPAYTRFLHSLGQLVELKGQRDVYTGGLDTSNDEDGEFAYAWRNEIAQVLYHTATLMPNRSYDAQFAHKKKHLGNDYVRIVWNDSGLPYSFDTLKTEFQFVNVIIEPHSMGVIAAYSNSLHEHEFFKIYCQRAEGMPDFGPLGEFKVISAESLSHYAREISLLADFFAPIWVHTQRDTKEVEYVSNWRSRLQRIKKLRAGLPPLEPVNEGEDTLLREHERFMDFTRSM